MEGCKVVYGTKKKNSPLGQKWVEYVTEMSLCKAFWGSQRSCEKWELVWAGVGWESQDEHERSSFSVYTADKYSRMSPACSPIQMTSHQDIFNKIMSV